MLLLLLINFVIILYMWIKIISCEYYFSHVSSPNSRKQINVVINVHARVTLSPWKCRQDFVDPRRKANEVKVWLVSNLRLEGPRGNFQGLERRRKRRITSTKAAPHERGSWRKDRERNRKETEREDVYEIRGGCTSNKNVCQMTSSIHGGQALFECRFAR